MPWHAWIAARFIAASFLGSIAAVVGFVIAAIADYWQKGKRHRALGAVLLGL